MKRVLLTIRDGKECESYLSEPLGEDEQGNLQTLERMAEIVREDYGQPDIRRFILREIVGGIQGHNAAGEVQRIFEFARDEITYRQDPWNYERVADLWSTLYALGPDSPEGDCGIKSTFIATCCAALGHKPFFVTIKQTPNQSNFNHVYNGVLVDGELNFYDATPNDSVAGWEAESVKKYLYSIFQ